MGAPWIASAFSTIAIARSTPAQKPRGFARRTSTCALPCESLKGLPSSWLLALGLARDSAVAEALPDQQHDADADRRIGDVERGPIVARGVQLYEIDDLPDGDAVVPIAYRPAEH